jgi:hypothetical protein
LDAEIIYSAVIVGLEHGATPQHVVVARLDWAIQYAAASRSLAGVSGILDHPLSRAMTAEA